MSDKMADEWRKRTKERQEMLDLLSEHLSVGMNPRQVAEVLDKNYHSTSSSARTLRFLPIGQLVPITHVFRIYYDRGEKRGIRFVLPALFGAHQSRETSK